MGAAWLLSLHWTVPLSAWLFPPPSLAPSTGPDVVHQLRDMGVHRRALEL